MKAIRRAMTSLAFAEGGESPYADLYHESVWTKLREQFQSDIIAMYGANTSSALTLALSAGLSALRTVECDHEPPRRRNCPGCCPLLGPLSSCLPLTQPTQSHLLCDLTGEKMDDKNPPYVLPSGQLISLKALQEMEQQAKTGGLLQHPVTREKFRMEDARKAFIM